MLEDLRVCFMVLYFDNSSYLSAFVLSSIICFWMCVLELFFLFVPRAV